MRSVPLVVTALVVVTAVAGSLTATDQARAASPNRTPPPSLEKLEPKIAKLKPRVGDLRPRVKDVQLRTGEGRYSVASDVLFAFDSATLSPGANDILSNVADGLRESGAKRVTVTGHTDSVGSVSYNQRLSKRRANAVRDYLEDELDDPGIRYTAIGKGESQPVAANKKRNGDDNPDGRAKNRRVTVTSPR